MHDAEIGGEDFALAGGDGGLRAVAILDGDFPFHGARLGVERHFDMRGARQRVAAEVVLRDGVVGLLFVEELAVGVADFDGDAVRRLAVGVELEVLDLEGEMGRVAGEDAGELGPGRPEVAVGGARIGDLQGAALALGQTQNDTG
jgi:hypothetical protein